MTQPVQDLLEQLRSVLATSLDAAVTLAPGGAIGATAWRVRVTGATMPWTIAVDATGATALARAMTSARVGGADAVAQAVHDWCGQAVASLVGTEQAAAVEAQAAELVEWTPTPGMTTAALQCEVLGAPLTVAVMTEEAVAARPPAGGARPQAPALDASRFGVLMDIDVPLVVRFGCTDMSLKALSRIGPGSVIDLSRAPEDPVEVLVGGRVVAHGQVVVVSGHYGIRIVDVVERRPYDIGMEA